MIFSYFDVLDFEVISGWNSEMYKELCKLNLPYESEWCGTSWQNYTPKAFTFTIVDENKFGRFFIGETTYDSCYCWEFDRNGVVKITLYNGDYNGMKSDKRCIFTFPSVPEEILLPYLLEEIERLAKKEERIEEEQRRHKRYLQIRKNLLEKVRRKGKKKS